MATKAPPRVRRRADARPRRRRLPADRARSAKPLDRLLLDGRRADMQVGDRLLDARLARTIEGPNTVTLTLWDADGALLRSGTFGQKVMTRLLRAEIDGLRFAGNGVSKQGANLALTFEDEVVYRLRRHGKGKPLRASRGHTTRAHFCARMIRSAGVPVIVLDEDVVQPIAGRKQLKRELDKARNPDTSSRSDHKGPTGPLTIKGTRATTEQRRNVAKALDVAAELNATDKPTLALLVAGIAEGQFVTARKNQAGSGATGPWQIMPATARGIGIRATDVKKGAEYFLAHGFTGRGGGAIDLARNNPSWSIGEIANTVEGGGAGAHFYQQWHDEAKEWLEAVRGGELGSGDGDHAWVKEYDFERKKNESTWAACWRLLVEEVRWRLFVREGVVVIASDPALMRAAPALAISGRSEAVVGDIDFDWHRALRVGEASTQVYAQRWQADPGEVVAVDDLPQVTRRWLLATVEESLLGARVLADVTLRAPQKPAPEPRSEVGQSSKDSGSDDGTDAERNNHGLVYPLDKHGTNGGGPEAHGQRAWGNWQSDNAVDIMVPMGTRVVAVDDGEIVKLGGHWDGTGLSNPNGYNVTLKTSDNSWFYTHLRFRNPRLKVGDKVKAGDFLGGSGAANGAKHLHIACEHGNPVKLLDV